MAFVCTARWVAREGQADTVRELLRELIAASRAEPGNLSYQVSEARDEPATFRLFEVYADEEAFRAHADSEHFRRLVLERAVPLLEDRERQFGTVLEP